MQGKYFNPVLQEGDVETRERRLAQYLALAKAQDPWPSECLVHLFCYMALHLKTSFLMKPMPNLIIHCQNFKVSKHKRQD